MIDKLSEKIRERIGWIGSFGIIPCFLSIIMLAILLSGMVVPEDRISIFAAFLILAILGITMIVFGYKRKSSSSRISSNLPAPKKNQTTHEDIKNASAESIHGMIQLFVNLSADSLMFSMLHSQIDTIDIILHLAPDRVSWSDCKALYPAISAYANNVNEAKLHPNEVRKALRLLPILTDMERQKRS